MSYENGCHDFEVILAGLILFVEPCSEEDTIVHAVLPTHEHPHTQAFAFEGSLVPRDTPDGFDSPPRHTTFPGPIHKHAVSLRSGDHRPVWGTFGIRNRVLELLPDPLPKGSPPVVPPLSGSPPCGSPPSASGLESLVSLEKLGGGTIDRKRALCPPWWNRRVAARVDFDTRYWCLSTEGHGYLDYCFKHQKKGPFMSARYVRATTTSKRLSVRVRSLCGSKTFAFTGGGILGVGNLPELPESFVHFSRLYDFLKEDVSERWVPCEHQESEPLSGVDAACTPARGS